MDGLPAWWTRWQTALREKTTCLRNYAMHCGLLFLPSLHVCLQLLDHGASKLSSLRQRPRTTNPRWCAQHCKLSLTPHCVECLLTSNRAWCLQNDLSLLAHKNLNWESLRTQLEQDRKQLLKYTSNPVLFLIC